MPEFEHRLYNWPIQKEEVPKAVLPPDDYEDGGDVLGMRAAKVSSVDAKFR